MNSSCLKHLVQAVNQTLLHRARVITHPHSFATTSFHLDGKSVVPQHPVTTSISEHDIPPSTKVDLRLVQLLEKLSLVDFANKEGIAVLEAAISMADKLTVVNTEGVEPMITVLEDRSLQLGEDEVSSDNLSEEVIACAQTVVDDYFVVPPGNITYTQEKTYHMHLEDQS